uniref:Nudix hydrolase domain-containing protein n=1 Tax=Kalanchoe fedtschenkoi TaxID=63787 RepID=A0A7N0ZTL4_KALFE
MPHPPPPHHRHAKPLHFHKPATSLPDFIYAALSLAFLFSTTATSSLPKSIALIFPQSTRNKLLRNPNMSISNPNPNPNSRRRFSNPQALSEWLRPRMPTDSFAAWGVQPGTKNVHNLWLELSEGETSLADSIPPVRTVQVVTVRILDDRNRVLVESHQELSDGTIRYRGRPLSEKMKPGETVEAAVDRAIREELGSILYKGLSELEDQNESVKIIPDSYSEKVEERVSASYPGLPACYVLHTVAARIDCLPDEEFCTEEDEEYEDSSERNVADKAVSVKRHYWKWVDSDKRKTVLNFVLPWINSGVVFSWSRNPWHGSASLWNDSCVVWFFVRGDSTTRRSGSNRNWYSHW